MYAVAGLVMGVEGVGQRGLVLQPRHQGGGDLHRLEDRDAEAQELLERALQLEPDDPDVIVSLGEVELSKGNLRRAEERAKEALAISAEHQHAHSRTPRRG